MQAAFTKTIISCTGSEDVHKHPARRRTTSCTVDGDRQRLVEGMNRGVQKGDHLAFIDALLLDAVSRLIIPSEAEPYSATIFLPGDSARPQARNSARFCPLRSVGRFSMTAHG